MYKSTAGRQAIHDWYDARLRALHLTGRVVSTPAGETHVIAVGDPARPALVLLSGTNFAAWTWHEYLAAFASEYRVFAVDAVGQPGRSAQRRPPFHGMGYVEWLRGVFDALSIERAHIAGHSLGGWLALRAASHLPERVGKLALLDPAGIIPLTLTMRVIVASLPFVLMPGQSSTRRLLRLMTTRPLDPHAVAWMTLVSQHWRSSLAPPPLPADELGRVKAPSLLLSGERDVFLPPNKLARRAREVLSNVQVEIVPGAGHLLAHEQAALVIERIRAFLAA
jgi:pimeloyl-ACP methyl ester carboxylesterase